MTDLALAAGWLVFLAAGLGAVLGLHRLGLPSTYARDLVHVGAGSWVLGWPAWEGRAAPLAIVYGAVLVVLAVPRLAALRDGPLAALARPARAVRDTIAHGDESWAGIVAYTVASAAFTTLGLGGAAFPAAAALLALALGDGLGGAVGVRFGRHRYRVPGAKPKSVEGSIGVLAFACLGVLAASAWFGVPTSGASVAIAGLAAAVAEALSPRASDNLLVPVAVWATLTVLP